MVSPPDDDPARQERFGLDPKIVMGHLQGRGGAQGYVAEPLATCLCQLPCFRLAEQSLDNEVVPLPSGPEEGRAVVARRRGVWVGAIVERFADLVEVAIKSVGQQRRPALCVSCVCLPPLTS